MTIYPKIQLSRLREIGWKLWDPIGLADENGSCDEGYADEYDRYLLHAVSLICRGGSKSEATAYLTAIASEHMGLSVVALMPQRLRPKRLQTTSPLYRMAQRPSGERFMVHD